MDDEKEVAEKFNEYFVEKIALLKQDIDKTLIKDPLEKLANKMKNNKNRFSLKKTFTHATSISLHCTPPTFSPTPLT